MARTTAGQGKATQGERGLSCYCRRTAAAGPVFANLRHGGWLAKSGGHGFCAHAEKLRRHGLVRHFIDLCVMEYLTGRAASIWRGVRRPDVIFFDPACEQVNSTHPLGTEMAKIMLREPCPSCHKRLPLLGPRMVIEGTKSLRSKAYFFCPYCCAKLVHSRSLLEWVVLGVWSAALFTSSSLSIWSEQSDTMFFLNVVVIVTSVVQIYFSLTRKHYRLAECA